MLRALSLVLGALLFAGSAQAILITYLAEGTVDSVSSGITSVEAGDPWTIRFTVDDTTPGDGGNPEEYDGAIVDFKVTLTSAGFTVSHTVGDLLIGNDFGAGPTDLITMAGILPPSPPTLDGLDFNLWQISLGDDDATVINSTALPGEAVLTNLAPFEDTSVNIRFGTASAGYETIFGTVDRLVPEPTTALLLATGLAGLAFARQRRSLH